MELALVPIHVDALALTQAQRVVGGLARFDRLPWSDGESDHNADQPWLSRSVERPCFEDPEHTLFPGIHLHWTLPDGITRGASGGRFAAAPDRWLVRRLRSGERTEWIVESDYLHDTLSEGDESIVYPVPPSNRGAPYARLGRMLTLEEWLRDADGGQRARVTAVGYGEASFAAFYPACRSVFGFHDAGAPLTDRLLYEVIGWYSHADDDPLGDFLDEIEPQARDERAWSVLRRFNWRFSDLADEDDSYRKNEPPPPRRTICYARIEVSPGGILALMPPFEVALADTGAEALAAISAQRSAAPEQAGVEASIDALSLRPELEHRTVDLPAAFEAARHERSFLAEEGGHIWALRRHGADDAPAAVNGDRRASDQELTPTLASHLNELNSLQWEFDRLTHELASLRTRLFADWTKYMLCAYPTLDSKAQLDLDEIRSFLRTGDLAEIGRREAVLGSLALQFGEEGGLTSATAEGSEDAAASRLAAQASRSLRKTAVFNATGLSGRRLGEPLLEVGKDGRGHLVFDGATTALSLDWIDGWGSWPALGDRALLAFTVWLRVRVDAAAKSDILSFDPAAHFAIGVRVAGGATHLGFTTADGGGTPDLLLTTDPVPLGKWLDLVAVYDHRTGAKQLWIDGAKSAERFLPDGPAIGSAARRWGVLGAASQGESFDAPPEERWFKGAVARLAMFPDRALAASEVADMAKRSPPASVVLRREGAPRFWRPRDPVVMLKGPAAKATGRHGRGELRCHRVEQDIFRAFDDASLGRPGIVEALFTLSELIENITDSTPDGQGVNRSNGAPWHPLLMEWETAFHPLGENGPHAGKRDSYTPDFITASFALDPDGPELRPLAGTSPIPERASISSGRAVLTPFASRALARRREAASAALGEDAHPVLTANEDHSDTQSQSLGGFHAALLQQRQGFLLPPDDPLAFEDRRELSSETIRTAVGRYGLVESSPDQPFLPIRAGNLEIRRLRLIDAFGRVVDIAADRIARPTRLTHDGHPVLAVMPPRLSQPARLSFRWLSAENKEREMNDHPATSPVCGWILASYLDEGLQIYDADGRALGEIAPDADHPWRPTPGDHTAAQPEQFANAYLSRIVRSLIGRSPEARGALLDAIRDAIDRIHPAPDSSPSAISLIMSRPLAVVRASLDLQLHGLPAVSQDWGVFARDLRRRTRDDAGFTRVRFPLRLGEKARLEDGLVGFWREDADGLPTGPFHLPALGAGTTELGLVGFQEPDFPLPLALADPPTTVTMLLDPMGVVHATSGILPVKSIRIPPEQYAPAMERIGTSILTAPVLAPGGRIAVPLPSLPGLRWAWRDRGPQGWREVSGSELAPPRLDGAFEGQTEIREGWLILDHAHE